MDEKFDFLPNKRGRRFNGGVDRISELPDEIIIHILSFLTLKKAAATSVLSSRWLDLWKHIPHLKFDRYILPDNDTNLGDARRCNCIEIVNTVIQSHKAIFLKKIRLALHVDKSDRCAVTKWLAFVFSRQVESLDLNLSCHKEDDNFVLEELLRESRICLQPQTDLIFFQSLKRLRLKYLKVSGEDIELLLLKCPLLEQLTIRDTLLTSDVEVCGEKLMLKHLDIYNCKGQKSIKVSAPNLTYIKFHGHGHQVITDVGRSPHQHLKVFELEMSPQQNVSDDDIMQLVIYISNNCVALQEIIIDRRSTLVDPATRDLITQRLQGEVPDHIQLKLFNNSL